MHDISRRYYPNNKKVEFSLTVVLDYVITNTTQLRTIMCYQNVNYK